MTTHTLSNRWAHPGLPRLLRRALHGTVALLLAVALVSVLGPAPERPPWYAIVPPAGLFAAIYAVGPGRTPVGRTLSWLCAVTLAWAGLLAISDKFSWLAFPLFILCLQLLPLRWAGIAVTALTGAVVAAQGAAAGAVSAPLVTGPAIGALVTTLAVLGYRQLYREAQERQTLIDELVTARDALVASQREAGRLAERQRLAGEIHDTVAQGLASIAMLLRAAESALPPGAETGRRRVIEAADAAAANLAECRRFVYELTPPALQESTLPEALRRLVTDSGAHGLETVFHLHGRPYALGTGGDVALLRLTQEALANVKRHAQASNCAVSLSYLDEQVTLDIFDDGAGFDPEVPRLSAHGGFGLHGMRRRIDELGGAFTVESAPGEGTVLAASVPLPIGAAAA